jgi:2-(1,2-epoxy-1,2-dihydrophenyl)acetyl-CoA isomerase
MNVLTETKDTLCWITLNRPEASNAYTPEMIAEFVRELKRADADPDVRVVIVTGAGKSFCAGGDVKAMKAKTGMFAGESNELRELYQQGIQQIPLTISAMKRPVIAMVNGAAVGAGLDLAAMCDLRVAAETATFAETFAKLGLVPGDGGAFFLERLIGLGKAMELFLTARMYSSAEALSMGLVNMVVAPEQLREKTRELAATIAALPPIAVQMTKRAVYQAAKQDLESHLELMAAYQGITQRTHDHFEAVDGFLEKKTATFQHT